MDEDDEYYANDYLAAHYYGTEWDRKLCRACQDGNYSNAAEILRSGGDFDINYRCTDGSTPLHLACASGNWKIVELLISHAVVDVNARDEEEHTPFHVACYSGETKIVQGLLKDPRVQINTVNTAYLTPLSEAARSGNITVVQSMIASGRELNLGSPDDEDCYAIGKALEYGEEGIAQLMERFQDNPVQTTHEVRTALGLAEILAASIFSKVIFACDGLLNVKEGGEETPTGRFFAIAARMPIELQMILCNRAVGSANDSIKPGDSDMAFRELASEYK